MLMLQVEGFSEAYLREQSPDWLAWAHHHLARRYRTRLAEEASVHAQGTAASQSEESAAAFEEMIQGLRGDDDSDLAYLLDPNAQTDMQAAQQSGLLATRPPKEEPDGSAP